MSQFDNLFSLVREGQEEKTIATGSGYTTYYRQGTMLFLVEFDIGGQPLIIQIVGTTLVIYPPT